MIVKTKTMYCDGCKTNIEEEQPYLTTIHTHGTSLLVIVHDTLHFCITCAEFALHQYVDIRKRPLVIDCENCHGACCDKCRF